MNITHAYVNNTAKYSFLTIYKQYIKNKTNIYCIYTGPSIHRRNLFQQLDTTLAIHQKRGFISGHYIVLRRTDKTDEGVVYNFLFSMCRCVHPKL